MSDLSADTVHIHYEFEGQAIGRDGYTAVFVMDDSFRSWWSIVRWNLHYRHWGALRMNARDLFTKTLWKKVRFWRR